MPVVAAKAVRQDVPVEVGAIGKIQAYETVSVKSPIAGAESRRPLGLVVVGGLVVSQALMLWITPVFYIYMEALAEWLAGVRSWGRNTEKAQ